MHLSVLKKYIPINLLITTHYQRKLLVNKLIKLSLQYAEVIEMVKKNINEYNAIIIKTEDNHEGKSLKDLLLKEVIMLMMHNWIMPIRKKTEILNCKLFDISDGEPMMIKVTVCTSMILAGQFINNNVLYAFI